VPAAVCSPLTAEQLAAATELAREFLDESGAAALASDFAAHPELAMILTVEGVVAGVAFGHPDSGRTATGRPSTWS
jgi:hypothetical protein